MLALTLRLNALFSGGSALVIMLLSKYLAAHIPLPNWCWLAMAVGLASFALYLAFISLRIRLASLSAPFVIASDLAWVVASLLLMLVFMDSITSFGLLLILGVDVFVAGFALFQYKGWRMLTRSAEI